MQSQLVTRFIEAVKVFGPKSAVVDWPDGKTERSTSFDTLMLRARQVATFIKTEGITPQSFVTLELPAGMEFLAAEMGVWMARCVAVPIGTTFPEERKSYIRNHCDAVLNIDQALMDRIGSIDLMDETGMPDETDNALLVYTSGSTGTPKGILHDHRSLAVNGLRMYDTYHLSPDDRFAGGIPPYFIAAIYYWKLILGTEVHFVPTEINKDIVRMAQYHRDHGITIAFVSATVFPLYRCIAPSIRVIITGSDRVICREKPTYRVENTYGLSETVGPVVHTQVCEPTENAPIGLPIPGVEFALLDDELRPVPQGTDGEICLKGYFCKGYFKDEERTQQLYRGGWLHTNDLGRLLPDGRIQFVNRKDWMVKVNGQRVEPGEVEAAMCAIEGISRAVVKGFLNKESGSQYLVGYYTPANQVGEAEVRSVLEQKLPSYMVPSFFVPMEQFPLNANGKIDRKSLQAPERKTLNSEYVAPRNEVETALCDIMARVMNLPRVGIDDNFRELGGDSIQMMTLQQMCADSTVELLHNISTAIIYQGATPRKMAEMLGQAQPKARPQMDDYPLNEMQKGYFFACMENPSQPVGNIPSLYRIPEQVDIERLKEAIEKTVNSHETFHTRLFMTDSGEPRQKIVKNTFNLTTEHLSKAEFEVERERLIQPYSIFDERLFRIRMFEVEGTHYLYIDVNHIIFDGTSRQILYRDIDRSYRHLPIEEEDWTLGQMAAEECDLRKGETFTEARDWFLRTFDKEKLVRPLPPMQDGARPESKTFSLDISYSEVEQFCQREGVTINVITMAAYMLLLGSYADTQDVTILTAYNARDDIRTRNTIGYLATNPLVRGQWTPAMPRTEFLLQIRQNLLDAMGHSIFKFSDVFVEWGIMATYQFICQGDLTGDMNVGGNEFEEMPFERTFFPFSLEVQLFYSKKTDNFNVVAMLNNQLHGKDWLQRCAERFTACLRGLMTARTIGEAIPEIPQCDKFFNQNQL